jgi:hypothetical protein
MTSNEFFQNHYIKQCKDDLFYLEKYIAQTEKRLYNLRHTATTHDVYADDDNVVSATDMEKMCDKTRQQLEDYKARRERLRGEIAGFFDEEKFGAFVEKNQRIMEQQHEQAQKQKIARQNQVHNMRLREKKMNDLNKMGLKYDKTYGFPFEKQMDRTYNYYLRTVSFLPSFMQDNLRNMPGNKGYVWRGIVFFGQQPPEDPDLKVLFERNGSILYIHEIRNDGYKVFIKDTKDSAKRLWIDHPCDDRS